MSEKKARLKRKTVGELLPKYNFTEGSNRSRRRELKNRSLRNFDRQIVPEKIELIAKEHPLDGYDKVITPSKVVFHKKKDNLPRLYPNMKG